LAGGISPRLRPGRCAGAGLHGHRSLGCAEHARARSAHATPRGILPNGNDRCLGPTRARSHVRRSNAWLTSPVYSSPRPNARWRGPRFVAGIIHHAVAVWQFAVLVRRSVLTAIGLIHEWAPTASHSGCWPRWGRNVTVNESTCTAPPRLGRPILAVAWLAQFLLLRGPP